MQKTAMITTYNPSHYAQPHLSHAFLILVDLGVQTSYEDEFVRRASCMAKLAAQSVKNVAHQRWICLEHLPMQLHY